MRNIWGPRCNNDLPWYQAEVFSGLCSRVAWLVFTSEPRHKNLWWHTYLRSSSVPEKRRSHTLASNISDHCTSPSEIYLETWGFLFTCMTTRAVHIEVAHSLHTDSCVMGIERSIPRRGRPSVIFSNNGTNFIWAEKELVAQFRQVKGKVVADCLAGKGILWKLNPPAAPHHGGSCERLMDWCRVASANSRY